MTAMAERIVSVVSYSSAPSVATKDIALILGLSPDTIGGLVDEIAQHVDAADTIRADAPFVDCPHRHPHCIAPDCARARVLRHALTETGLALGTAEHLAALAAWVAA